VPRLLSFVVPAALAACAPTVTVPAESRFVLVEPKKYKTDVERDRAQQIAQNDCKTKAMAASAALEKSVASERSSRDNLDRAKEKGAEMYTASFALCMNNAGYIQK
jgi:hypothetical protein